MSQRTVFSKNMNYCSDAVQIEDDGAIEQTEGQNFTIRCILSGAESVNDTVDSMVYQWIKNNGTQTEVVSNSMVLSFSPLKEIDFGQYTCQITVNSSLLIDGTATIINIYDVGLPKSEFLEESAT